MLFSKKYFRISLVGIITALLIIQPATTLALDQKFMEINDIYGYNPTVGCATVSDSNLTGGDNTEKAFNYFVAKGLTPQQSAGIVGNMIAESGVLPMRQQSTPASKRTSSADALKSGLGWGLVQWTPPSKMINPSTAAGKSHAEIDTLEYQLNFLWEQLEGTGTGGKISEKAAGDHLKQQTTIDGSARSFMTKYERPADQSERAQSGRAKIANDVFGKFGTSATPPEDASEDTSQTTPPTSSDGCNTGSGGDIVSIAQAELAKGVKENPIGCDRGNPSVKGDCGPEVNKYTDNTLEYWCADFVSWVYREAGKPFTGGQSGGWRLAGVAGVKAWFEKNKTYTPNGSGVVPKPGDAYFHADISHIGIVEKIEGDKWYGISGNTSTDNTGNGNGVGRAEFTVGNTSQIVGFGTY